MMPKFVPNNGPIASHFVKKANYSKVNFMTPLKVKNKCKKISLVYLATKRAESEGIKKAPFTNFTGISDTFAWPRLWSLIQENNFCTVDNVGLN